jgi:hypothetical protein
MKLVPGNLIEISPIEFETSAAIGIIISIDKKNIVIMWHDLYVMTYSTQSVTSDLHDAYIKIVL